ncbi:MAG: sulfatase-like hydrolase/transferase [Planctomycetota bacterium]|jgi:arylsulfatase A-like enzyme
MDSQTRRRFLRTTGFAAAAIMAAPARLLQAQRADDGERPNILWITSEDNSPYLGCYGDKLAHTPNLDRFAAEGVRYRNAFANAPVCSAARSTLITGMYACSLGIHNHRSKGRVPDMFRLYPEYLRDAGYYCTNNSKTDYNIVRKGGKAWNESSNKAHYKNRKPGQPFFAVFNTTLSHEGQLTEQAVNRRRRQGLLPPKPRVAPEDAPLPPYHADTPTVRRDWSVYYDNVTLMDKQVGALLEELQESGLAGNTIVFYYSDHGGALPRGKRNIHDSGTRVPLIVRFPQKWAHLAPARPGQWVEDPVSFVDLPPTVFSLANVTIPKHFEGRPFLGKLAGPPRNHIFLFRGRMDERYDTVRAVRNRRYRYVRNYSPHRPWGQHYSYPFRVMPSMDSWYQAYRKGQCNPVQARYWQTKPSEEFYDVATDPYEVTNLIDDPQYADLIKKMRRALQQDILRTRDTGFIPEGMFERLAAGGTLYDYAQSDAYPIERIVNVANLAVARDVTGLSKLMAACDDPHPVIRYWAATGCLVLQAKSAPARHKLEARLKDDWLDIRVVAAEALCYLGQTDKALATLEPIVKGSEKYPSLAALNALDFIHEAGHVTVERIREIVSGTEFRDTPERMAKYFLEKE